jgi:DNA-binding transcriptional ArsR family regulator
VPATPADARALAHPVRLRILRITKDEPLTNKQLAERLGRDPATVLHHVRLLVRTGFLAPGEQRRGARGAWEIPYLATGRSWTLDFDDRTSRPVGDAMLQAFLEELRESGGDLTNPLRAGLWLTDDETEELGRRVSEIVEELRRRHRSGRPADATRWSLFFALHREP